MVENNKKVKFFLNVRRFDKGRERTKELMASLVEQGIDKEMLKRLCERKREITEFKKEVQGVTSAGKIVLIKEILGSRLEVREKVKELEAEVNELRQLLRESEEQFKNILNNKKRPDEIIKIVES